MAIRGRKIKMAEYIITQIDESEIDETIFEDMVNQSLSYIESDPPNLLWEEFGINQDVSNAVKLQAMRDEFKTADIVYKLAIDGYLVMYEAGRREKMGEGMFCVCVGMTRPDLSGSNAWSYSKDFTEAVDPFYKSISDDIPETSTWVIDGSGMYNAYMESVTPNNDGDIQNLSVTNPETMENHYGYVLKKLVIIRNT